LDIHSGTTITGPGSAFSVCDENEDVLYVYDPNPENANFGFLKMCSFVGNEETLKMKNLINS